MDPSSNGEDREGSGRRISTPALIFIVLGTIVGLFVLLGGLCFVLLVGLA